ncbi:MAG: hypothetical protein HOO19_18780 [Rhodospirillaceae bacterium]|jgi:hypothetical protein|nr:hypothetical protein [Rhodospirillaceae bacterium]MBT3886751.1 hypothetical protein [Rhodospirillaceae bacterium]MBT4115096.1 hypothetical protein [Rhodospirillaceae bacterium]MBT4674318.1 hypothetical protein [Rhodospirillaceae bacterium]MBT4721157.1 hypothetical protein [Rhodospirillaceae bacterium]
MSAHDVRLGEVLFEFIPNGRFIKVIAIDPITMEEIAMVGDRRASVDTLERLAINKLRYVIAKKRGTTRQMDRFRSV